MKKVTETTMLHIIRLWQDDEKLAPSGLFYCFDGCVWVGCDNSHGDCWVEEFKTEVDVRKWLNNEPVLDINDIPLNGWTEEMCYTRDDIIRKREEIYDEICRVLTDWEMQDAVDDDLYNTLVKIQNNWESVITAKED